MGPTGNSSAARSYTSVLEDTIKDSFKKVGIRFVVWNQTRGTAAEALCLEDEEEDVDVLTKDFLTGSGGGAGEWRGDGGGTEAGGVLDQAYREASVLARFGTDGRLLLLCGG